MPVKVKRKGRKPGPKKGRKRRVQRGAGFFGDVWSGIKKGARGLHDFVKEQKLISKGLGTLGPYGQIAAAAANQAGYRRGPLVVLR